MISKKRKFMTKRKTRPPKKFLDTPRERALMNLPIYPFMYQHDARKSSYRFWTEYFSSTYVSFIQIMSPLAHFARKLLNVVWTWQRHRQQVRKRRQKSCEEITLSVNFKTKKETQWAKQIQEKRFSKNSNLKKSEE